MRYQQFEDLPAWQSAAELALRAFALSTAPGLRESRGIRDQLERAALSVSNNIAEGFERGTHAELISFLYIALGSAGEVRSMLSILERHPACESVRSEIVNLKSLAKSISRQLSAWLEALKNSGERGPRYRNDGTRRAAESTRRGAAFLEKLDQIREESGLPSPKGTVKSKSPDR